MEFKRIIAAVLWVAIGVTSIDVYFHSHVTDLDAEKGWTSPEAHEACGMCEMLKQSETQLVSALDSLPPSDDDFQGWPTDSFVHSFVLTMSVYRFAPKTSPPIA